MEEKAHTSNARTERKSLILTRETARSQSRDAYVQANIRELMLYCVYLTFLSIAVLGTMTSARFYYSNALAALFIQTKFSMGETTLSFEDLTTKAEFLKYTETAMIEGLFWDFWYSQADQVKPTGKGEDNVLYENRMVGRPRLRQVRVRNDSCRTPEIYRRRYPHCYDYYSASSEDKSPFGKGSEAYVYKSADELESGSYIGWISWYRGGGYAQTLPPNREEAVGVIKDLKNGLWIDRATRAIFIDFTVYNPNIDMFCISKLVVEFPPQGAAIPSWSILPAKFSRFTEWTDYLIVACDFVVAAMTGWYIFRDAQEFLYLRWAFFGMFWKWIDSIVNLLRVTYIVLRAYTYYEVHTSLKRLMKKEQDYAGFDHLAWLYSTFHDVQATLLFLSWFTLLKYLDITKSVSRLHATISHCALDLVGFVVIFFIALWTFGQVAYVLFGHRLAEFRTWDIAMFTLIRILLGDYGFRDVHSVERVLPSLFFLAYIFVMYFILMSMFLAIINNAYGQIKYNQYSQGPEIEMPEMIRRGWRALLGCCGRKFDQESTYRKRKAFGLSFDQIRNVLRSHNFSEREINQFFDKFNIRAGTVMTESAVRDMLSELEQSPKDIEPALSSTPILYNEYNVLQKRITKIEEGIAHLDEKLEQLLTQPNQ